MNVLREPHLVALNELIIACRNAANRHRLTADATAGQPMAADLARLAEDRERAADRCAETVLNHDDIPSAPAPEKAQIETAITWAKAGLSGEPVTTYLADCLAEEDRVREAAKNALAQELNGDLRQEIERLRDDTSTRVPEIAKRHGLALDAG